MKKNAKHESFAKVLVGLGIASPELEFRFDPTRRWRFDFAWPERKVALEVEGGAWTGGRHTRGKGFLADIEKYNRAACLGWVLLRCTPGTLMTRETVDLIRFCTVGAPNVQSEPRHE